jgi:hypothetical protein
MQTLALVVMVAIALVAFYLAVVATICVVRDRTLSRVAAVSRLLVSWWVPLLGAILTIRVATEESTQDLPRRWWLWPLRLLLIDAAPDAGFAEVTDMRADAERILPGHTLIPPP